MYDFRTMESLTFKRNGMWSDQHIASLPRKNKITKEVLAGKSYGDIAKEMGISRQRVQQLNRPDKETIAQLKARAEGKCEKCGKAILNGHPHHVSEDNAETYQSLNNLLYLCTSCHRLSEGANIKYCPVCGRGFKSCKADKQKHCSRKCLHVSLTTTLSCTQCGKKYELLASQLRIRLQRHKTKNFFCSKECQGKWAAEKYGFKKGQARIGGRKAYIDSSKVVELYKTKTAKDIAIEMNISQSYIYQIIREAKK